MAYGSGGDAQGSGAWAISSCHGAPYGWFALIGLGALVMWLSMRRRSALNSSWDAFRPERGSGRQKNAGR
jgi:MYXO-CTERM domain-containing protein